MDTLTTFEKNALRVLLFGDDPILLYFDQWSSQKYLENVTFINESVAVGVWNRRLYYAYDFKNLSQDKLFDLIGDFRTNSMSYFKILILSKLKLTDFDVFNDAFFEDVVQMAETVYVSCYDDEGWIAADVMG